MHAPQPPGLPRCRVRGPRACSTTMSWLSTRLGRPERHFDRRVCASRIKHWSGRIACVAECDIVDDHGLQQRPCGRHCGRQMIARGPATTCVFGSACGSRAIASACATFADSSPIQHPAAVVGTQPAAESHSVDALACRPPIGWALDSHRRATQQRYYTPFTSRQLSSGFRRLPSPRAASTVWRRSPRMLFGLRSALA